MEAQSFSASVSDSDVFPAFPATQQVKAPFLSSDIKRTKAWLYTRYFSESGAKAAEERAASSQFYCFSVPVFEHGHS